MKILVGGKKINLGVGPSKERCGQDRVRCRMYQAGRSRPMPDRCAAFSHEWPWSIFYPHRLPQCIEAEYQADILPKPKKKKARLNLEA
jgi:hypothetical protein